MKILVVGGGGREHALTWRLAADPDVTALHCAPGNAGIAALAACHPVKAEDVEGVAGLADALDADLVVVGSEAPLVAGLADVLRARGRRVFGPTAAAARLEGSKAFAKDVMQRAGIPTAAAGSFTEVEKAAAFVDELGGRAVVKADGLAAGKGVVVAEERDAAVAAIRGCLERDAFGEAGRIVVVEELLEGPEVSAFALCDGSTVLPLALAQDHKRAGDGDTGPNTGGMGAYSPVPAVDAATQEQIWSTCVRPAVEAMAEIGSPYRGVLFAGLMLTADGPKVLEYNCRFGDPETQVLMPRLDTDPAALFAACADGDLAAATTAWREDAAVAVVMASGGYPGAYATGVPIEGVEEAAALEGVTVFHAGTARGADGRLLTAGGRVLAVTGTGDDLAAARERAYAGVDLIRFDGAYARRDIAAWAALEGEEPR
ncbi:MAG: phosphoribosylamine--glycine ligase [Planctomycetaceae bacterium]